MTKNVINVQALDTERQRQWVPCPEFGTDSGVYAQELSEHERQQIGLVVVDDRGQRDLRGRGHMVGALAVYFGAVDDTGAKVFASADQVLDLPARYGAAVDRISQAVLALAGMAAGADADAAKKN